jgi:hypothetical protein
MRRRTAAVFVALVTVVTVAALSGTVGPAAARRGSAAPTLVCGELPTTDVVLRADLTCDTGFHFVGVPPVNIDLGGHVLSVPGDAGRCTAPGPCGAIAGATSVRNGTVAGTLSDIGEISRVLVHGGDVEVAPGFSGAGGPASVQRTIVVDGMVRVWGPDVTVAGNVIRGRVVFESTNRALRNVVVERNWIVKSPGAGVSVSPQFGSFPNDVNGRISRNIIVGSTKGGIEIGGGLSNIGDLRIEANLLMGNGGDGFRSGTDFPIPPSPLGGPVTVSGNLALFNAGHGLDAGWIEGVTGTGIVDGGGNRAGLNGTSPQCIGVTC